LIYISCFEFSIMEQCVQILAVRLPESRRRMVLGSPRVSVLRLCERSEAIHGTPQYYSGLLSVARNDATDRISGSQTARITALICVRANCDNFAS
jgi:hypothetical protein